MQKNVLIGNGVNIQYGGKDVYSNEAILKRMVENIRDGKYCHLLPDCSIGEQLNFFEKLHDLLVNIGQCNPPEVYLFLLKEVERIKNQYGPDTVLEQIGMEDYFLALEYGIRKEDSDEFVQQARWILKVPMLDAIYNDGKINNIDYGTGFEKYITSFDKVFTLNYDSNLDRYRTDVKHLHGEFSKLAPEFDSQSEYSAANPDLCRAATMVPEFAHVYSNTIMSWYWLEKYGKWTGKESEYGADEFQSLQGQLEIVGMSPSNDNHLFHVINSSGVTSVKYYYYTNEEKLRMQSKISKPLTFEKVENLWRKINQKI